VAEVETPWWRADVLADRRPFLEARGRIVQAIRAFFTAEGFVEVETPILQRSPGNEVHLAAFATERVAPDGRRDRLYLHTSPEFACKKLVAGGIPKLFTLARVFRNGERGRLHHPEFTMLEWYRARAPYEALIDDCAALVRAAATAAGASRLAFDGHTVDPAAPVVRVTVAEACRRHGIDLFATLADPDRPDRDALAAMARLAGVRVAEDDAWSDVFTRILVEKVEPSLDPARLTALTEYPVPEAALARRKPGEPRVAERFELFACGVELANAFGELTDADEQRRRFRADMDEKERRYGERHPVDEDLLAAVAAMPETSGIALGLDRLVMLATGARRIEDVLWAPVAG
jgi:lysyl-tRNA synthetase class 2